jgi:hypothetical protein
MNCFVESGGKIREADEIEKAEDSFVAKSKYITIIKG